MKVLSYKEENLIFALQNKYTSIEQVSSKNQIRYLTDYLGSQKGLGAKQIVIEEKYINKDYLSDYSNYYSTCFASYGNLCKRVHFFKTNFTESQLKEAIVSDKHKRIWENYLGFIVVKPIPLTVI